MAADQPSLEMAEPPGAHRSPDLAEALAAAYAAKGPEYKPRTHLLTEDGRAKYVNRLILEASPYLLQHAHNPVDWRAWGPEALAEAEAQGKPIFLSVGYATCHWCHVMEEESFDNEAVAALLNTHFIAIKIDREQRPDLDQIYITATQLQQGHAGWPNSVFLRPDGAPFHTGTYFPRGHFMQVLAAVAEAWRDPARRPEIDQVAAQLSAAIQRQQAARMAESPPPGDEIFAQAAQQLAGMHNALEGGFSDSQQFPQEGFLLFLLDNWRRTGDDVALDVATSTLTAIAAGGIHDHAGGGFHRYTVDPNWRTPHFEKMLYNQGQLARAFIEGWEATGTPAFARAAERAFAYVLREMTDAEGAFYAAEDADSLTAEGELEEGTFYIWTPESFATALGGDAAAMTETLGMDQAPTLEGSHVLHFAPDADPDFAALEPVLERLRQARASRARPFRDDKVIAGWNGLMIRALAEGAVAFGDPALAAAAARAGETLWTRLWDGRRLARLWAGEAALEAGNTEDYSWLGLGYLALYEATGDALWLDRAALLARTMATKFADGTGRLKMAAADGPLGPVYDSSDGATPAGESSALELLARAGAMAGDAELTIRAEELRAAISAQMVRVPLLRPDALMASRMMDAGPSAVRRTLAQGRLRLHLRPGDAGAWRLRIDIAEGWHLNAHAPGPDWLIGAALEGAETAWPDGIERDLGFAEQPIRVYEGTLDLPVSPGDKTFTARLQACSDEICLDPVEATFRLP